MTGWPESFGELSATRTGSWLKTEPIFRNSDGGPRPMLDLFYIGTALLFFSSCWALTKACEKL